MILSIITINYNNAEGLRNTIESVLKQSFKDFEYIIVDGASTDKSLDIIKSFDQIKFKWISEKDKGIYDAMNKGVTFAKGKYLLFLNSGDIFFDNNSVLALINSLNDEDLVYGNMIDCFENPPKPYKYPDKLSLDYMICNGLPHQATAIKKELFKKVGLYNDNYDVISDWAFFMLAIFRYKASYKYIDLTICSFEGGGLSSSKSTIPTIIKEQRAFIKINFNEHLKFYNQNSTQIKRFLRTKPRYIRWYYKVLTLLNVQYS